MMSSPSLAGCSLYTGSVSHTRLKGGAIHKLEYPIFFASVDLESIESLNWSWWPLLAVDKIAFSSLNSKDHMKGWEEGLSLSDRVRSYVQNITHHKPLGRIKLITHLTYFGYCFNPVSFYFIYNDKDIDFVDSIVVEVSNTPWIEQHIYILKESIPGVDLKRETKNSKEIITATWRKEFHVSPFMEMDYLYRFQFEVPAETFAVQSKLLKEKTNEVWLTANFSLNQMAFTPRNLLYLLVIFPLHTRMIQIWIHYEAIKIWFKGVPLFPHPLDHDVDFGFGISGKKLGSLIYNFATPFLYIYDQIKK